MNKFLKFLIIFVVLVLFFALTQIPILHCEKGIFIPEGDELIQNIHSAWCPIIAGVSFGEASRITVWGYLMAIVLFIAIPAIVAYFGGRKK